MEEWRMKPDDGLMKLLEERRVKRAAEPDAIGAGAAMKLLEDRRMKRAAELVAIRADAK